MAVESSNNKHKSLNSNIDPGSSNPLQRHGSTSASRQMTIFYGGQAHVFDDVHPNKVRVCRLWESLNSKKNGELISLDMVIVDEKQTLMTATMRKNLVPRFDNLLKEGGVYIVQNFKVVSNSGDFRVTDSKFKILFTLITKLKKVDDYPGIPMHGFQFVSQKIINARVNDNTILTDIVGCLTVVGEVETVTGGFRKRDLEFVSDSSITCKVTLWGEIGEKFSQEDIAKDGSAPIIIIITSTQVKKFQGVINFATSRASKVYLNLNNEYVASLAERFAHICPRVTLLEPSFATKKSLDDEMFENRMDIQTLLMAEWVNETKGYPITILGVIDTIETQHGWFYLGCKACCRKVTPVDGTYTCRPPCNTESENCLTLYKIHVRVRDDTGTMTCVVLQKNAERLVDSSALKLFNKSDPNSSEFPDEITALCGQKFVFRLSLSEYNIKHGSDTFTVNKVFEPNDILEKNYKDIVEAKVKKATNGSSSNTKCGETSLNDDTLDLVNNMKDDNGTQLSESEFVAPTRMRKRKFVIEEEDDSDCAEI